MAAGARAAPVVVYWRPGCGFCVRLRRALERAGVEVEERDIWQDPEAAAFVRSVARGNETVPTVVVAGEALVNPSAAEVIDRIDQHDAA
jgi:mycoredoxin